jgi:hypothetical protein
MLSAATTSPKFTSTRTAPAEDVLDELARQSDADKAAGELKTFYVL